MTTLVDDLDTLEGRKEVDIKDLDKSAIYSIRIDFPAEEPRINTEVSFKEMSKIIKRKEYKGARIYIKKGSYFD